MYDNKYWNRCIELNDKLRILEHELDHLKTGTDEYTRVSARIESCMAMMDSSLKMSRLIGK